ncbi:hypothetical protein [Streptomyces murinus]
MLRYQLPTVRTRFVDQLKVMLAVGCHVGVFTSRQLEVPGVSDHRKGLVIGFLHSCGLLARRGGRGVYTATPAARRIAKAWERSETLGRRELAIALDSTWFAEIARQELREQSGQRIALADRLLAAARAPETRRGEVEILIMWLLEARLLLPVSEGYVCWNADAHASMSPEAAETAEQKKDVAGADGDRSGVDDGLVTNAPGPSQQVRPECTGTKPSSDTKRTGQKSAADPVVDSVPSPAPRDQDDRSGIASSFEGPTPNPLPKHPHTTVSRAGIAEDEMLEGGHAPDAQPKSDGGSPLRSDVIPPQAARSADTQSVQPRSQLTELAHLGELASQPINLHDLLRLSEEELLSMYRGLRRFVDFAAGTRDSGINL